MSATSRRGEMGERLAALFLQMRGLRLLEHRYRVPGGEIDLVMAQGDTLVFVEVKTRGSSRAPAPEQRLGGRQLALLRRTAGRWLQEHGRGDVRCRLDLVTVDLGGQADTLHLRHYEGVDRGVGFAKGGGPL